MPADMLTELQARVDELERRLRLPTAGTLTELQARAELLERRLRLIADVAGGFAPGAARERLDHVRDLARELVA